MIQVYIVLSISIRVKIILLELIPSKLAHIYKDSVRQKLFQNITLCQIKLALNELTEY